MKRFPHNLTRFVTQIVYVFSMTGFFLIAALLYEPKSLCELLRIGEGLVGDRTINISIFCAIIFVTLLVTRLILYFLRPRSTPWYVVWCFAEIVVISAFIALYTTLMGQGTDNYFVFLGRSFSSIASILVFPYAIVTMAYYLHDAYSTEVVTDDTRLKFHDNRHLLKFVAQRSSILYFEAETNYVLIHYEENGVEKIYELRNSMKSVETIGLRAGFVRTHRSYIVNPAHIKLIAKGTDGRYYATLGMPQDTKIPVSKKYNENIVRLL